MSKTTRVFMNLPVDLVEMLRMTAKVKGVSVDAIVADQFRRNAVDSQILAESIKSVGLLCEEAKIWCMPPQRLLTVMGIYHYAFTGEVGRAVRGIKSRSASLCHACHDEQLTKAA